MKRRGREVFSETVRLFSEVRLAGRHVEAESFSLVCAHGAVVRLY